MTQHAPKAVAHSVALIAMYLMNGYEAEARIMSSSKLQEMSGHLGVADELACVAAAIHDHLESPEAQALGTEYPGVLEYEVIEPIGQWLHANSICTVDEARTEFARRFEAWMKEEPAAALPSVLEIARKAVEARVAYRAALLELETATAGREGGWPRFRRTRVEEIIDTTAEAVKHHPTSPLQALVAVAQGIC